jgi:MtN3 and saliva related transmembrane protein
MEILTNVVGYMAATVGMSILLPQVYKSIKTKKANDISMTMLVVYTINVILWEIYGWLITSVPIMVCNLASLFIGIFQIYLKVKYSRNN